MELVEVEIITTAITNRYGTLSTGTRLKTDAGYAEHLVKDCGAAKYVDEPKTSTATKSITVSADLTVKQLQAKLAELNIPFDAKAKKEVLVALLTEHLTNQAKETLAAALKVVEDAEAALAAAESDEDKAAAESALTAAKDALAALN